jgi:carboxyl-terminal processing protease
MKKYLLITLGLFLTIIQTANGASEGLSENNLERFNQVVQVIKNNYVEPVANEKILKNALQGLTDGLDPHSEYLDVDELKDLQAVTSGQFGGLGLEITLDDNFIKVVTPLDDTPAQKAGIKSGDVILRIDSFPTKGMTLREASKKMRGPKGSSVTLMILHKDKNKPVPIKLVRDDIKIQSVKSRVLEPGLGYLRIASFQTMTDADADAAIKKLSQENHAPLKGLILDLRNNPGGLLDVAAKVTNNFLDPRNLKENDLIVYTKGRTPDSRMQLKAQPNDILFRAPMVVLINEGSASGAEIVAGALQDHKRALIVGARSFGKGSVQTIIPLDDSTALKLTTALYYTPAGRSIQAAGIMPDVKVDDLKITQAAEDDLSNLYTKEADLRGHIANAQSPGYTNLSINKKLSSNKQMLVDDYQLTVALYLLKAMTVWQK